MRLALARSSVALVLVGAAPAFGQSLDQLQKIDPITHGLPQPPAAPQQKTAPSPALPGAASNTGAAAPAARSPTDMEPTDALFDAINRGDMAGARDAINRGADLNGHNILGMTPMELSVDLGRNDISFLLLSLRPSDDGRSRPPPVATATAVRPAPARPQKQEARRSQPPATVQVAVPAQAQTARLFSGDGGTPIPNAGFLGFDSGRR